MCMLGPCRHVMVGLVFLNAAWPFHVRNYVFWHWIGCKHPFGLFSFAWMKVILNWMYATVGIGHCPLMLCVICAHLCVCAHVLLSACGGATQSHVLVDTKATSPHSLSNWLLPAGEGAGAWDERLRRWWGGDSLAMFTGWKCRLGAWLKGTVTSGIHMVI